MLPSTMKALVKEQAGPSYEYKEVPVPAPQGDELLVKVGKVALCGSDIALHQWNQGGHNQRRLLHNVSDYSLQWPRRSPKSRSPLVTRWWER